MAKKLNRYSVLIEKIFFDHYSKDDRVVEFERTEIEAVAAQLKIALPKNLGDVLYSFRFRTPLPDESSSLSPKAWNGSSRWQARANTASCYSA